MSMRMSSQWRHDVGLALTVLSNSHWDTSGNLPDGSLTVYHPGEYKRSHCMADAGAVERLREIVVVQQRNVELANVLLEEYDAAQSESESE